MGSTYWTVVQYGQYRCQTCTATSHAKIGFVGWNIFWENSRRIATSGTFFPVANETRDKNGRKFRFVDTPVTIWSPTAFDTNDELVVSVKPRWFGVKNSWHSPFKLGYWQNWPDSALCSTPYNLAVLLIAGNFQKNLPNTHRGRY